MIDKTPEQIIALAKECGGLFTTQNVCGSRLTTCLITPSQLQAFAAVLTAAPQAAKEVCEAQFLARHKFWGAGESDCPSDLKAPNGELHTKRCKVCGDGWRKSIDVCFGVGAQLQQTVARNLQVPAYGVEAARSAEQGDTKDAQRLDYCYQRAVGAFINAPITKQQWLNGLDAAIGLDKSKVKS